jgi:hypothetical protein
VEEQVVRTFGTNQKIGGHADEKNGWTFVLSAPVFDYRMFRESGKPRDVQSTEN